MCSTCNCKISYSWILLQYHGILLRYRRDESNNIAIMALDIILTIVFGVVATAIGLITVWQNSRIVQIKVEILQRAQYRPWYA
ncbi:hypothetical protein EDD37DRAFT_662463, partial [Exophiala viscosa]|uniref:uncharacterized protein n=1 Tax=Exophiala viscosa TaxID=2486360 RepID=UPI002192E8F0